MYLFIMNGQQIGSMIYNTILYISLEIKIYKVEMNPNYNLLLLISIFNAPHCHTWICGQTPSK